MTREAEFYVERERTSAIGDVHVATEKSTEPVIEIDPHTSSIEIGGVSNRQGELRFGSYTAMTAGGAARLVLGHDRSGLQFSTEVELDASGTNDTKILVTASNDEAAKIANTGDGGRVAVLDSQQGHPVVQGEATRSGGRLSVHDLEGDPTGEFFADDAALVLTDGDAVVKSKRSATDDIHVYIQGERDSDYGVDAGNRPRIHLDGPEARLDLGREDLDENREGVNGEIDVRGEDGNTLLQLRASDDSAGELRLRGFNGSDFGPAWSVVAHPDGLMIRDANEDSDRPPENVLLITNRGELKAARSIDTF